MTQAIWIDSGAALDAPKLRAHGITVPYFSHLDPNVTADYLTAVQKEGFSPGIYTAWNWYPALDGAAYARQFDAELKRIGWKGNAPVCVDIETHDVGYILAFFSEWRRLRPSRPTSFTMEGFQGGLFSPANVAELVGRGLRFVPQLYDGNMVPLSHSPLLDMMMSGFPGTLLDGFYDAAALPYRWRGFAFTQARLP